MRTRFLIGGLVALALAVAAYVYAAAEFTRLVVSTEVVVPSQAIPAYTLVTADMLTVKEVPRSLLSSEAIYVETQMVVGKITTVFLPPATLIYRHFAVPAEAFRLTADPGLEIVAFPVSVAAAVGGEVAAGQRINIYRAVVYPNYAAEVVKAEGAGLEALLATRGAAAQLLAGDVPVVAVQSARGARVNEPAREAGGEAEGPLQIVTVAVPPATARQIVELVAEGKAGVQLWVSLAPVNGAVPVARRPAEGETP